MVSCLHSQDDTGEYGDKKDDYRGVDAREYHLMEDAYAAGKFALEGAEELPVAVEEIADVKTFLHQGNDLLNAL